MSGPDDPKLKGQNEGQNHSSKPPTEGDQSAERVTTPRTPPAMTLEGEMERKVNRERWRMDD